ncbi:MAG: hypothetical protein R2792_03790 [Saprospiraceae bacterium]
MPVRQAQLRDAVWILGYEGGTQSPPDDDFGGFILNFRDSVFPQQSIRQDIDMNLDMTNASRIHPEIYCFIQMVKNLQSNHVLMQNGDGIATNGDGHGCRHYRGPLFYLSQAVKRCITYLM